jgi:hypothetical protein
VAGTVDIPVLQDLTFAVGVGRARIPVPAGYLPAMHILLCPGRSDGLFDSVGAVVGMHGGVAVAVENNGRDRLPDRAGLAAGPASLRPIGIKSLGTRNS